MNLVNQCDLPRCKRFISAVAALSMALIIQACGSGLEEALQNVAAEVESTPELGAASASIDEQSRPLRVHSERTAQHEFRIRAVNSQSSGDWSEFMVLNPNTALNDELASEEVSQFDSELLPEVYGNGMAQLLQWPNDPEADGFEIQVRQSKDNVMVYEGSLDADGICDRSLCRVVTTIEDYPEGNIAPFVVLNSSDESGFAPLAIQISAADSVDIDGKITGIQWFVRGLHVEEADGSEFNHLFQSPGEYDVVVVVTDDLGSRSLVETKITVNASDNAATTDVAASEGSEPMAAPEPSVESSTVEELVDAGILESVDQTETDRPVETTQEVVEQPKVDETEDNTSTTVVAGEQGEPETNQESTVDTQVSENEGSSEPTPKEVDLPGEDANSAEEVAPSLLLLSRSVSDVTTGGATIAWQMSDFATGQIEYGTSMALGNWSTKESSFRYKAHAQPLTNLAPDTEYFYRLHGKSEEGAVLVSNVESFKTLADSLAKAGGDQSNADGSKPSLLLLSQTVSDISSSGATIRWQMDDFATGQIEYGTSTALGSWSTKETSFTYDAHLQALKNLEPDTEYFYRLHSTSEAGGVLESEIESFRTLPGSSTNTGKEAVAVVEETGTIFSDDWPRRGINEELPMAGVFYGSGLSGRGTANGRVSGESSRRFRAERTGHIVSYTYHNRLLRDSEIIARCDAYGEGSVWCKCKNAGLGQNLCGYTLGNSYHVGNGGTVVVELRPDDGTGKPSDIVLGKTYPFVPTENRDQWFATLDFVSPAPTTAGGIYHLVHTNLTPPTKCGLGGLSLEKAATCSTSEGAQGLNGSFYASTSSTTGRWGPFRGDKGAATLYKRRASSEWKEFASGVSYYEVEYSDGISVGDTYHAYDALKTRKTVQGNTRARQLFTVQDMSRNVNGIWLVHGHAYLANGRPLKAEVKDDRGNVLATASLSTSAYCRTMVDNKGPFPGRDCRDWSYADLSNPVSLLEGSTYSVEFSGPSGSGFVISTYDTLANFDLKDRNQWRNARAQYSNDNGRTWRTWEGTGGDERDMALLFTIVGMPKQLK